MRENTINCNLCGKISVQSTTTDVTNLPGCTIIINNVPCYVCEECGETMYFDDIVEEIQGTISALKNDYGSIIYLDYGKAITARKKKETA